MTDEAKKARNAYAKKWRDKNPQKVKEINNRYWERKAQQAAKEAETTDPKTKEK